MTYRLSALPVERGIVSLYRAAVQLRRLPNSCGLVTPSHRALEAEDLISQFWRPLKRFCMESSLGAGRPNRSHRCDDGGTDTTRLTRNGRK